MRIEEARSLRVQPFQPLADAGWKRCRTLCHPEERTCLRQVKSEMNAEIDIDSIGFVFCSLGAVDLPAAS
jgi:hypothetical protein